MAIISDLKYIQAHGLPRYESFGMDLISERKLYEFFQRKIIDLIG